MKHFEEGLPVLFVRSVEGKDVPLCHFPEGLRTSAAKEILREDSGLKLFHVAKLDADVTRLQPGQKVFLRTSKKIAVVLRNYVNRVLLSTGRSYNKNEICTLHEVTLKEGVVKEKRETLLRAKDVIVLKEINGVVFGSDIPGKGGRNVEFTCEVTFFAKSPEKKLRSNKSSKFGISSDQVVHTGKSSYNEFYAGESVEELELFLKKGKGEALIRALNK